MAECYSGTMSNGRQMLFPKNISKPQGPMFACTFFSDLSAWANRQVRVNDSDLVIGLSVLRGLAQKRR